MDAACPWSDDAAMETALLVIAAVVFLAAGAVKGMSGLGLPTLSMALLGLAMPPAAAAALMVVPSLATNLAQCAGGHWRALSRRLWPMWTGLSLATVFSPLPDLGASGSGAQMTLGVVLIAYGLWGSIKPSLPEFGRYAVWFGGVAGVLSGVLAAATGVFVMPLVPFLQSLRLTSEALIQALGLSFTVATLALAIRLGSMGSFMAVGLPAVSVAVATAFLGLWLGTALRRRLHPSFFQRVLYGAFVILGLVMICRTT